MRKLLAFLLAICLLSVTAVAETTEANIITYDFGHFSLDFPEDIGGSINERTNGGIYFILYPDYDENTNFASNLNCVWQEQMIDSEKIANPSLYAQTTLKEIVASFEQMGYVVSDPQVVAAGIEEIDGLQSFSAVYNYTIDYSGVLGYELIINQYTLQATISDESFGAYVFTVSSDTLENAQSGIDILNTLKWTF